jgi:hypothetical protein
MSTTEEKRGTSPSGKPEGRGSASRNVTETQGKKGHGQQKLKQKKK